MWPWRLVFGRKVVMPYVASLSHEPVEWVLAFYVDEEFQLLAADTLAQGDVSSCKIPFWKLIERGHTLEAAGFVFVHNHPTGNATPSMTDIRFTRWLAPISTALGVPLLDHFIVGGDELREIPEWCWRDEPYRRGWLR